MNEKIRAYARGEFKIANPMIRFSVEELSGSLIAEQSLDGEFTVQSGNDVPIEGHVQVFDHRIEMVEGDFATTAYTVHFQVHAKGMKPGEEIKGSFYVLTNGGEYEIPYRYFVTDSAIETEFGMISNLDDFAALAQNHYETALTVFTDPLFETILGQMEQAERICRIYQSLRKGSLIMQAMEEFLVSVGKKEPVLLKPARDSISVVYHQEDVAKELRIKRNHTGYVDMKIKSSSDAVFLAKTELTRDDFVGDEAVVPIVIAIDRLLAKECVVDVVFSNTYQSFSVAVRIRGNRTVGKKTAQNIMFSPGHLKKTYQKQLVSDYLEYRTGNITLKEYTTRSIDCANELMKFEEPNHWYRLIRLHMYIMRKDRVRVAQEMETVAEYRDKMLSDTLGTAYYSYLTALYSRDRDTIARVLKELNAVYEENPSEFLYFFMIMYLDEEYVEDKTFVYEELTRIYEAGSNSPMLYYEACELYNEYPNTLKTLSAFELQALYWGFRRHFLNDSVRSRFIELAHSNHRYEDKIFKILDLLYQNRPQERLLQVICAVLMKGNCAQLKYHHYFALGVKHSFKLIGLMEYYLKSMDRTQYPVLPQQVVLYFNYEAQRLNDELRAYLYANVVTNKDAYGSAYEEYREPIGQYLIEQVRLGHMSEDLVVLYRAFLREPSVAASVAKELPHILFKWRFVCENPNITSVLVDYDECRQTSRFDVVDGVAYVDFYTDNAIITLVDRERRRYVSSIPYDKKRIIEDDVYLPACYQANPKSFPVLLRLSHYAEEVSDVDYEIIKVYKTLLEYDDISAAYRRKLNGAILEYYYQQYEGDIFEDYLKSCDLDALEEENRNQAICYMIDRELYDAAMQAVRTYGYYGIRGASLKELCNAAVSAEELVLDELLVTMAFELFHADCYTEAILKYLIRFAKGSNRELVEIYQAALKMQFATLDLEERIVTQALLSDVYDKGVMRAFESYMKKNETGSLLSDAFLNIMAYRFLVRKMQIPKAVIGCWLSAYRLGQLSARLNQAALLYALTLDLETTKQNVDVVEALVKGFVKHDMLFPFMRHLQGIVELPKELMMKRFLTYVSEPGHQVNVHYYCKGPGRPDSHTERMREYFCGYYVKDFVLFADEELNYYVTDEDGDAVKRVEAADLAFSEPAAWDEESRFARLNELLQCQREQSEEVLIDKLDAYVKERYLIESNMTML